MIRDEKAERMDLIWALGRMAAVHKGWFPDTKELIIPVSDKDMVAIRKFLDIDGGALISFKSEREDIGACSATILGVTFHFVPSNRLEYKILP